MNSVMKTMNTLSSKLKKFLYDYFSEFVDRHYLFRVQTMFITCRISIQKSDDFKINFNPFIIFYSFIFLLILIIGLYIEYNEYSLD